MNATRYDQGGSVLIIAVIAMLILGILSFSFALLSRLEVTTGVNYKAQAQAEALAEAGLERGRDAVRTAADASGACGFSRWTDPGNSSSYGCDAGLVKLLFSGVPLGAGDYSVVIDNDCFPLVPVGIEDASCSGGTPGRDRNERAVLTAWATAANGLGRARVRAIVAIDTAWKHVCSSSSQDNLPGYCNEPANRNGNPVISPADPNEQPGGPAAYDDLPRPWLGCSAIDVTLHEETTINCPPGQNYSYPYPSGKRLVVAGRHSATANCDAGGQQYQGYFDCALTTPGQAFGGGPACVKKDDSRASTDSSNYKEAPCPSGATGMVFAGDKSFGNVGSLETGGRNAYVMRDGNTGQVTIQGGTFHGTLVVESNGPGSCNGPNRDMMVQTNGAMRTVETNNAGVRVYGYPLTLLVYDPQQPPPTAAKPFAPQQTCAAIGRSGSATTIAGLIYSGGHVEFTSSVLDGGVVAFEIQTQGSSGYHYSDEYGKAAPPPGFPDSSGNTPDSSGNTVIPVRKSFIVCADYAADTGGGTACR
jgi:hypothetical protein